MQRVTISVDDDLLIELDKYASNRGYASRSEALRDLVRDQLAAQKVKSTPGPCVATLAYLYDHEKRDLPKRLTHLQHHHHGVALATLHVHLDQHDCLEVCVLQGDVEEVKELADSVVTQSGVRYGHLDIVPVPGGITHTHTHSVPHAHSHGHSHEDGRGHSHAAPATRVRRPRR